MTDVFIALCEISVAAGWMVLVVLLLRLCLRKLPKKVFPLMWGLVGLRLLLPTLPHSKLAVMPGKITQPNLIGTGLGLDFQPAAHMDFVSKSPADSVLAGMQSAESAEPMHMVQLLALVWVIGVAAMLLHGMVQTLRLRLCLRTAIRIDEAVCQSDRITYPFVFGILRPRIYLPFSLGSAAVPYVLAHEKAHISRRDYLWKPLGYVLLCIYWFHPLLWMAYFCFCRDLEYACDEKVIARYKPVQRLHYSEALLSVSVGRSRFAVCPVAFGTENTKQRIRAILSYKKPVFGEVLLCAVLVAGLCGCFFTQKPAEKAPILAPPKDTAPIDTPRLVPGEQPTDLHTASTAAVISLCEPGSLAPYRVVNYKLLRVERDTESGRITGYAEVLDSAYLIQNGEAVPQSEQAGMMVFHLLSQEDDFYTVQDAMWVSHDDPEFSVFVQDGSHMEELQQQNAAQAMLYAKSYREGDTPVSEVAASTVLSFPIARGSDGSHIAMDFVVKGAHEIPVPVPAIAAGEVVEVHRGAGNYGNYVVVHHGEDLYSLYAHLKEISVETGQKVTENQTLGTIGMTGRSSDSHLHLEVHKGDYKDPDTCVNPSDYLLHLPQRCTE